MGCNNTLTDSQLEAIFVTTDEETRQIEQPMECLIETTQRKCKKCTRFFSNEAAPKQHHCEPPIKKEKHPHCGKVIISTNNLEKHLRSCKKAPTHPTKQQLCQMTLDWPTSFKNGPSTPKKLMVEEVQGVGAAVEHAEHWKAPEIVESTLKYTGLAFRKTFNGSNKIDVLQRSKNVIHGIRPVIGAQTQANVEAVKWYLSLNMDLCNFAGPGVKTDPAVTFCWEVVKSIDTRKHNFT